MSDIKTLADIPLDAPIPTTESLYVWSDRDRAWVTWPQYVFGSLVRDSPRPIERTGGGRAVDSPSPLFLEEVS